MLNDMFNNRPQEQRACYVINLLCRKDTACSNNGWHCCGGKVSDNVGRE